MLIKLSSFKGMAPMVDSPALDDSAAQTATNIDFSGGTLRPMYMPADAGVTINKAGYLSSIYRYVYGSVSHWLKWVGGKVSFCLSTVPNDSYGRVFWTTTQSGITPRRSHYSAIVENSDYPAMSYELGIPKPGSFTATADNSGATTTTTVDGVTTTTEIDTLLDETRMYVITFVEETWKGSGAMSFEGPPSDPSNMVTVSVGGHVDLSGLPSGVGNDNLIAYKNIYRTNSGSSDTSYQYVATIPASQETYSDDTVTSDLLGEVLPSETWVAPPADLQGLIALPSGALAGFSGNTVSFSVPYIPTAWPAEYDISVDFPIVAIACYGSGILVLTKGNPYVINGVDPGSMTYERLELGSACASVDAVIDFGDTIVYPSTRGLMAVGTQGVANLTEGLVNLKIWQDLHPATARAAMYDSFYLVWTDNSQIMFNIKTGDYSLHDIGWTPDAVWTDPVDGCLYLSRWVNSTTSQLYKWGEGDAGTLTWKSKRFRTTYPLSMAAARVIADGYSGTITCKIYANRELKHTQTVTSTDPFRLPSGFMAREWEIEITAATTIYEISIASSIEELAEDTSTSSST